MPPFTVAIGPSSFGQASPEPLERLEAAGACIRPNPYGRRLTEEETVDLIDGVQAVLAGLEPLTDRVFASAKELKVLARVGIGMDNVNLEAAQARGIRVSNTPEGPTQAVAEMTLTAALCLLREVVPANAALHGGHWEKRITGSLAGAAVLVVGMGRIGRRTAGLFEAFGAQVAWYDPAECPGAPGRRVATLEEGLVQADVVSLHASGRRCILHWEALQALRPGAIILNAARGGLVDEEALCAALDDGRVAAVWCDAFAHEPYEGPLQRYPQALLTPHMSTYTRVCRRTMELEAVDNLLRDLHAAGMA